MNIGRMDAEGFSARGKWLNQRQKMELLQIVFGDSGKAKEDAGSNGGTRA